MLLRLADLASSLSFSVATPSLSLSLSLFFRFFLSSSVFRQIERQREGGADRERGRESKEEEEEDPEIAPGLRILPPSFSLLILIKNNKDISPGSSGSSILPFLYCFLFKTVRKSPGSSGSAILPFPYCFLSTKTIQGQGHFFFSRSLRDLVRIVKNLLDRGGSSQKTKNHRNDKLNKWFWKKNNQKRQESQVKHMFLLTKKSKKTRITSKTKGLAVCTYCSSLFLLS